MVGRCAWVIGWIIGRRAQESRESMAMRGGRINGSEEERGGGISRREGSEQGGHAPAPPNKAPCPLRTARVLPSSPSLRIIRTLLSRVSPSTPRARRARRVCTARAVGARPRRRPTRTAISRAQCRRARLISQRCSAVRARVHVRCARSAHHTLRSSTATTSRPTLLGRTSARNGTLRLRDTTFGRTEAALAAAGLRDPAPSLPFVCVRSAQGRRRRRHKRATPWPARRHHVVLLCDRCTARNVVHKRSSST
jgi:hypothetical protein